MRGISGPLDVLADVRQALEQAEALAEAAENLDQAHFPRRVTKEQPRTA
jgi:hypothetical protein